MLRRIWDEFHAYRRARRDGGAESIIVLAVAGVIASTADVVVAAVLGWVSPAAAGRFSALSKNARVAYSGGPLAVLWLLACFGAEWWRAHRS